MQTDWQGADRGEADLCKGANEAPKGGVNNMAFVISVRDAEHSSQTSFPVANGVKETDLVIAGKVFRVRVTLPPTVECSWSTGDVGIALTLLAQYTNCLACQRTVDPSTFECPFCDSVR